MPDLDYFSGRGAKDLIALYCERDASRPNLHPQLLETLETRLARSVTAQDWAAYGYAVLAHPAYTAMFADELASREVRVPVTVDAELFERAVALGGELLFLHTYGERFAAGRQWPVPVVKCLKAVPAGGLPETFDYDGARNVINVCGGEFGPVSAAVYEFEVSGLKVVQSWLGYRMKKRKGKASSPLDAIRPREWSSEHTSELLRLLNLLTRTLEIYPAQAELLAEIVEGPLLPADALGEVPEQCRKPPKRNQQQHGFAY